LFLSKDAERRSNDTEVWCRTDTAGFSERRWDTADSPECRWERHWFFGAPCGAGLKGRLRRFEGDSGIFVSCDPPWTFLIERGKISNIEEKGEEMSMEREWILKDERDTQQLGRQLANALRPGDVVALAGDLGTGKTALTKAVAAGLGVTDMITSPTFTIVCEYFSGRLPLYHFDVYRVSDPDELFEIGFEEYIYGKGVCLIEWADLIEDILPPDAIHVALAYGDTPTGRTVRVTWPEHRELTIGDF